VRGIEKSRERGKDLNTKRVREKSEIEREGEREVERDTKVGKDIDRKEEEEIERVTDK
jgi:hypothetical protein